MTLTLADLKAGDHVSALVFTGIHKGADRSDLIYVTVLRVNRKTVTVQYKDGHTQRVDPYHLNDKVDEATFRECQ